MLKNKTKLLCYSEMNAIMAETVFGLVVSEKAKTVSIKSFMVMSNCLLRNSNFVKLSTVVAICGTLHSYSANCGHGFWVMNSNKSKPRNMFEVFHLNNLIRQCTVHGLQTDKRKFAMSKQQDM